MIFLNNPRPPSTAALRGGFLISPPPISPWPLSRRPRLKPGASIFLFKVTNYLELHTTQEDSAIPKGCGTETWEEAVDLALHGWKDGLEHLEVAYKQVVNNP